MSVYVGDGGGGVDTAFHISYHSEQVISHACHGHTVHLPAGLCTSESSLVVSSSPVKSIVTHHFPVLCLIIIKSYTV